MSVMFDINRCNKILSRFSDRIVSADDVADALKFGTERVFKKGELILGMGEKMTKVYFITKGIGRSYYVDSDGNDVTKSFLLEYNFCVSESFFTSEPSSQIFEAIEKMEVIEFCAEEFKRFMLSNPNLKEIYIQMLEQTIVYKMRRESAFQLESATERYLNFKKQFPTLENRVRQSYIASYLGMTPVSLSRIRRALREDFKK